MNAYYGDFLIAKTVRCRFNTVNSSSVPTSLSSGAVIVSKDGSDVTPSGGVTLTADVGAVTGRNQVVIDMSVDGTTFTAGAEYAVRLSGTSNVGGTSMVGIVVGEWSVQNRSVKADALGRVDIGYVLGSAASLSSGTAQAGSGTQITLAADESSQANIYRGRKISVVAGTGSGQQRICLAYDGTSKIATLDRALDIALDATSQYSIDDLGVVRLDLTQALDAPRALDAIADTAMSLNDAAWSSVVGAVGREDLNRIALTVALATPGTHTVLRTFSIDSASAPTYRH